MTRRGLTLLEVLIAIALIGGLLAAAFSFLFNLLDSRRATLDILAQHRAANYLIECIEADLFTAIAGDASVGAGVQGDAHSLRILTRDVPARLADRGALSGDAFTDLLRAEYRFTGRRIEFSRAIPTAPPQDDASQFEGAITTVRFRYYDGSRWRDSYDSAQSGALPVAVEVAVWFNQAVGDVDDLPGNLAEDEGLLSGDAFLSDDFEQTFDERAFAMESDLEMEDEPQPDRIRVITLTDAVDPAASNPDTAQNAGGDADAR
jgi:prepilin-type N-terminal cleavage/methylation domain-containing protein